MHAFAGRWRRAPWGLVAAYPFAWVALSTLSSSAWFLPAGLRVAALCTTPTRFWPALALAEWIGAAAVASFSSVHTTSLTMVVGILLPWLIYAAVLQEVGRDRSDPVSDRPALMLGPALAGAMLAAVANALLLVGLAWLDDGSLPRPLDLLTTFALRDFTPVVALAPAAVVVHHDIRHGAAWREYPRNGLALGPALGFALSLLPGVGLSPEYRWVMVAVPLIVLGAAFGRRTTVAALAALTACFVADASRRQPAWSAIEMQRVLGIAGAAALVLGARWDWMHQQRLRLSSSIEELTFKTQALRDAATRLSAQKEEESRKLGLELHDEVGQDMTALATRLRLAERRVADEAMREELRQLQQMVTSAHDHLRSVIRHLHPIALERFGLERALAQGPLMEIAQDAGIRYECRIRGPANGLPIDVATAVYRICQEAMTNAVRHGCGGAMRIDLDIVSVERLLRLELAIADEAGAIDTTPTSGGLGLQGIHDRANALGAVYRFDPSNGRPRHSLSLSMPLLRAPPSNRATPGGAGRDDLDAAFFQRLGGDATADGPAA